MKTYLTLLWICLLSSNSAIANEGDTAKVRESKFYTGIGLTNISYHIWYKQPKASGHVHTGYFAPVYLNFSYRLNNMVRLQVGLAYGGSKSRNDLLVQPMDSVEYDFYSRTRVVALPIAMQHVLFRAFKRFPVYATATVMPAYGVSKSKTIETRDSGTTTFQVKDSGMDVFATAGVGFNYRISNYFEGYVEVLPIKYNITGANSFYHDWEQYSHKFRRFYRSLGVGVNYKLGLNK